MRVRTSDLPQQSLQQEVWIALDLETTGLSPDDDEIIEVGAVRFRGRDLLDTYQTFVNPRRELSDFIKGFTGISQAEVDAAPDVARVTSELSAFIGSAPIVGHNVGFDLGFLAKSGLRLENPRCDTWDMAFVLFPGLEDYSLAKLVDMMQIERRRPHRAVDDALAAKEVFLRLTERLSELDVLTVAEMQRLASRSSWSLASVFARVEANAAVSWDGPPTANRAADRANGGTSVGVTGLDIEDLGRRLLQEKPLRANRETLEVDPGQVASVLQAGGLLSRLMPGFEERTEQVSMALAVAEAINTGSRLIVEAGTGVGKSLAYLVPAALYALANGKRVVVSTNTINLQHQLLNKDVPVLMQALNGLEGVAADEFKFTQLKGRANYLCLRRFHHLRSSETLSDSEARLLAKTLVWLQTTETGDRGELSLGRRSAAAPWDRVSAQGATDCPFAGGPCFLRAAREKAAASHLVIVNHALLMSDLTTGGSLIPEYDLLIIDEAHHLEDEATRHLGFELGQLQFDDLFQSLSGDHGLLNEAVTAFRGSTAASTRRRSVEEAASAAAALVPAVRDHLARLLGLLQSAVRSRDDASQAGDDFRVTSGTRAQPYWSQIEVQWENVDVSFARVVGAISKLGDSLQDLEEAGLVDYDGLMAELTNTHQVCSELRGRLREFFVEPKKEAVYWAAERGRSGEIVMHAAPLHVGQALDETLFSQKSCVILTSATLSADGTFDHISERTGFSEADELLVGSPFDYPNAALLCVPEDMPEPNSEAYPAALALAITDATLAVGGQTMALFTSHASLQATASAIRAGLQAQGIGVLAQGIDGTPAQLVRRFLDNPRSVLLGTSSFWEGVDLAGDSLKLLLVARLPFNVPSEPVFAARSEQYEVPFSQYAVPQAVLRLRQGFGRLIRTKSDRGVAVILDRRVLSRRYGKQFIDSLPPVAVKPCRLAELGGEIQAWMRT